MNHSTWHNFNVEYYCERYYWDSPYQCWGPFQFGKYDETTIQIFPSAFQWTKNRDLNLLYFLNWLEMKLTPTLVPYHNGCLHKERSCRMFLIAVDRRGGGRGMTNKHYEFSHLWLTPAVPHWQFHCRRMILATTTTRTSLPAFPANHAAHSSPFSFFLPAIIRGESFPPPKKSFTV